MPSQLHETLAELFLRNPQLAARLLADVFALRTTGWVEARVESPEVKELNLTEWRADGLVTLVDRHGKPVLAVVVEVQLEPKKAKRYTWPVYLANIRERRRCEALVLVICPDRETAQWASQPIRLGPGSVVTPFALPPDQVPVVTDPAQAVREPELAVLSALGHGEDHPRWQEVLDAMWAGLRSVDADHADVYADVVRAALGGAARKHLEDLMMNVATYEPQFEPWRRHWLRGKSAGMAEGKAEGKAEGESRAVLAVLAARGIDVPVDVRDRIAKCTDLDQLELWLRRAATADSVHDLFS